MYQHQTNCTDESSSLTNYKYQSHRPANNMSSSTSIDSSLKNEEAAPQPKNNARLKVLIALPILAILLFAIIDSQTNKYIQTGFESFLEWISNHLVAGMFALMSVYALATVCLIPGAVLTIGSGFVYGNAFGLWSGVACASCVVFMGASVGVAQFSAWEVFTERLGW